MAFVDHISLSFLCAFIAMVAAYFVSFSFFALFDPNYHNGYSADGGLFIVLGVAVVVFKALMKKLKQL